MMRAFTKAKVFLFLLPFLLVPKTLSAQDIHLNNLKFKGNKKMSSGKLENAIETQANPWYKFFVPWMDSRIFDEDVFLTDLLRIEKFYQQEGYLAAKVTDYKLDYNSNQDEVDIMIFIDEGAATRVNQVVFQFAPDSVQGLIPERMPRAMKLKSGKRYRETDLKLDYDEIVKRFGNRGYPYSKTRMRPVFDIERKRVDLTWLVDPGPFCLFGEIDYDGNKHIDNSAIRRGLGFSTGDPFAQSKLINAQREVYRLELFQFVSLRATNLDSVPPDTSHIPIEVRVKEATLRTLKFGLGYGSEEQLRGSAQWRHRNFLGGARILRANAKRSTKLLPLEIETELSQPYFLSNKNDLIIKPFFRWVKERGFEERSIGAELTLNRRLTSRTNAFFTTIVEKDTIEVEAGFAGNPNVNLTGNKSKSIFRLGLIRNSSNEIFAPSRGSVTSLILEEAGRLVNTPARYIKVYSQHRFYKSFKRKNVFAVKFSAGSMQAIRGSANTPVEERFFLGGSYSVRGWGRQLLGPLVQQQNTSVPIGGNSMVDGSFELRRSLIKQFAGALFWDFGNVWGQWNGFDFMDLRHALGLGLRYNTLIGPIRLDFAWKLNKQPLDRRRFQFHFSIGQAF